MEEREMARWYAVARMVTGAALFVAPGWVLRLVVGRDAARSTSVRWLGRMTGGRDLLLGAAALTAYREGIQVGRWCRYSMVADFVDAVSTLLVYRRLRPRWRFLVFGAAAAGASTGGYLSSKVGEED